MKRAMGTAMLCFGLAATTAALAQDMMRYIDLSSPEMTSAEMTRGDVETALNKATGAPPADFTGKRLSGLDLCGLNLSAAILRAPRLSKTMRAGARLDSALLAEAPRAEAELSGPRISG